MGSYNNPFASFRAPNTIGFNGGKRFTTGTIPNWSQNMSPAPRTFHEPGSLEELLGQGQEEPNMSMGRPDPRMAQVSQAPAEKSQGEQYYEALENIRNNRGPALTAYQQALGEQPKYDQYKPSMGRRIGAGLIGAGAALDSNTNVGEAAGMGLAFKETPYRRAQTEYGERMKGLGASAKLEQDEMDAKLKSLQAARALGLDYEEFEQRQQEAEWKREHDEGILDVARDNADTSRFSADTGRRSQEQTGQYQQGQLNIGRANAITSRANQGSLDEYRREQIAVDRERIAASLSIAEFNAQGRNKPTPDQQQDAIDGALRDLMADPNMKRYIDDANPEILNPKGDDGTAGYRRFRNRLIEATNRRLHEGTPFEDMTTDEPFEITPGDPGARW